MDKASLMTFIVVLNMENDGFLGNNFCVDIKNTNCDCDLYGCMDKGWRAQVRTFMGIRNDRL